MIRNINIPQKRPDQPRISIACTTEATFGATISLIVADGAVCTTLLLSAARADVVSAGLADAAKFVRGNLNKERIAP